MKNNYLKSFEYNLGIGIVLFFFGIFLSSTLGYFLSWKISIVNILLSGFLVIVYWYFVDKRKLKKCLISMALLISASIIISNSLYDFSGDGQSYQQTGVIQIALDWNPIREVFVPDVWDSTQTVWLNHFPRFSWIVAGTIYKVLGKLEMSKILNLMLIAANLLIAISFLKEKFREKWKVILVSTLIAFNPICISEVNTFCVDTLLASLFAILMWNVLLFLDEKISIKNLDFYIFLVLVTLFNIKWPSIAYILVFSLLFTLYLFFSRKELVARWIKINILAVFFGIFGLAFNPYITNTIKFASPFYPLYTNDSKLLDNSISPRFDIKGDLMKFMARSNSPYDFLDKSWWWKFWHSIFSESANPFLLSLDNREINTISSKLKFPFMINNGELLAFKDSDVRVAGFGIWFSGALLVSLVLMGGLFIKNRKAFLKLLFFWVVILICAWVNPESWWARYVPFVWFLPVMTLFVALKQKDSLIRLLAKILGVILLINILLIGIVVISFQIKMTQMRFNESNGMLRTNLIEGIPVKIDFMATGASRAHYFERKVSFVETRIESGIMENYFFQKLDVNDRELMIKNYIKDEELYEYNLRGDISNEDLIKLALVFKKMEKVSLLKRSVF